MYIRQYTLSDKLTSTTFNTEPHIIVMPRVVYINAPPTEIRTLNLRGLVKAQGEVESFYVSGGRFT